MKIVVLDGYTLNPGDNPWKPIEDLGDLTVYERTSVDKIIERSREADIIITNKTPITKAALQQLDKLKYIVVIATGYNIVDVASAGEQGIPVSNIPEYGTYSVAQYVFALLLELCHHVQLHDAAVKNGEW